VGEAIRFDGRVKVLVEGEEDLLTLVAVLSAPLGSLVVYGQPRTGIVGVGVTEAAKRKFRGIVERMEERLSKH
ncbi:MAG: GTP-dependent dephospho-CoA kinase family protein, partial [Candidatus Bathyarchaeota archaeon]|nr:GTP-dependent dephospho-CoA kinase family protein [Candidatus Bathyarchaeota archaeon]